jgi:hypothetical protein
MMTYAKTTKPVNTAGMNSRGDRRLTINDANATGGPSASSRFAHHTAPSANVAAITQSK